MTPEQLTLLAHATQQLQQVSGSRKAWPIATSQVVAEVGISRSTLNKAKKLKQLPLLWPCKWATARIEYAGYRKGSDYWQVYIEPTFESRSA
jgi:hypothetical protein